jgi:hypothetical protein
MRDERRRSQAPGGKRTAEPQNRGTKEPRNRGMGSLSPCLLVFCLPVSCLPSSCHYCSIVRRRAGQWRRDSSSLRDIRRGFVTTDHGRPTAAGTRCSGRRSLSFAQGQASVVGGQQPATNVREVREAVLQRRLEQLNHRDHRDHRAEHPHFSVISVVSVVPYMCSPP